MDAVVYRFYVAGKPYIGMTLNLVKRSREHLGRTGRNPMYKVATDEELKSIEVLYTYTGKSKKRSYIRSKLKEKETELIKQNNSFLNGWNQQIANELPSQSIKKYILDYQLIKDEQLYEQINWKLSNTNLPWKVQSRLQRELWNSRWKNEK